MPTLCSSSQTPCALIFFFLSSILRRENWGEGGTLKRKINSLRSSKKRNWNNTLQIVQGRSFEHSIHAGAFFQSHRKIKQQLWFWKSSKSQLCIAWKTTSVVTKHGWSGGSWAKDTWPNKNLWGAMLEERPPLGKL